MPLQPTPTIQAPKGKLGILMPGMGAVATTFIAGVHAVRQGMAKPIGSLCEMGTIRLGARTENNVPTIREYVGLAELDDIVFGGWDLFNENCYEAAIEAGVLEKELLTSLKEPLSAIKPMKAVLTRATLSDFVASM